MKIFSSIDIIQHKKLSVVQDFDSVFKESAHRLRIFNIKSYFTLKISTFLKAFN